MGARKERQRELFDTNLKPDGPNLPAKVLEEAKQLLTQWLRDLSQTTFQEAGDEQNQR